VHENGDVTRSLLESRQRTLAVVASAIGRLGPHGGNHGRIIWNEYCKYGIQCNSVGVRWIEIFNCVHSRPWRRALKQNVKMHKTRVRAVRCKLELGQSRA
jgi:hypothetical protein